MPRCACISSNGGRPALTWAAAGGKEVFEERRTGGQRILAGLADAAGLLVPGVNLRELAQQRFGFRKTADVGNELDAARAADHRIAHRVQSRRRARRITDHLEHGETGGYRRNGRQLPRTESSQRAADVGAKRRQVDTAEQTAVRGARVDRDASCDHGKALATRQAVQHGDRLVVGRHDDHAKSERLRLGVLSRLGNKARAGQHGDEQGPRHTAGGHRRGSVQHGRWSFVIGPLGDGRVGGRAGRGGPVRGPIDHGWKPGTGAVRQKGARRKIYVPAAPT